MNRKICSQTAIFNTTKTESINDASRFQSQFAKINYLMTLYTSEIHTSEINMKEKSLSENISKRKNNTPNNTTQHNTTQYNNFKLRNERNALSTNQQFLKTWVNTPHHITPHHFIPHLPSIIGTNIKLSKT
jgi:hypothetical protein